jgi:hypothetical protein
VGCGAKDSLLTTNNGKLIAIKETAQEKLNSPGSTISPNSLAADPNTETGLVWTYTFPEELLGGFLPFSDGQGSWYGLSENLNLYAINQMAVKIFHPAANRSL